TLSKEEGRGTAYIGIDLRNEGKVRVVAGTIQANNYYQTQTGTLEIGISGTEAAQFGKMNVTGSAWLNGTLIANLLGDFAPAVGTSFRVLTVNRRTGDFRITDLPGDMEAQWSDADLVITTLGGFFISAVSPKIIPNAGNVELTLKGSGFANGIAVKLKQGQSEFSAVEIIVDSRRLLRARFSLDNIPVGDYDVIAYLPDQQRAEFKTAIQVYDLQTFSIVSVEPYELVLKPNSVVTFHIQGTQFTDDCQVYLKRPVPEEQPIVPQSLSILSPQEIHATFNLRGAKVGPYDLIVIKGNQQASFRIHLYPYMAVMTGNYVHPSILVVGRVTQHQIELFNWGNAPGVAVYGFILPSGFRLVGIQTAAGGEWGISTDGSIIIAQPVEPGEMATVTVNVVLPWDNVVPPDQPPQVGKYRLGDEIFIKGSLLASPVQDVWHMVRSGSASWDEIVARALTGYGTLRNLYLEELGELTMEELSAHLIALNISHPGVGEVISTAMRANFVMSFMGDRYRESRRSHNPQQSGRLWNLDLQSLITDWWEPVKLMPGFIADDVTKWQNWVVRGLALTEGLIQGVTLGLVKFNVSESVAKCLGVDPTIAQGSRLVGDYTTFAIPAGLGVKVGKVAKELAKELPEIIAVSKFLYKSIGESAEAAKYTQRFLEELDGKPVLRSLGRNIVWAIKGNPQEPSRIIGFDAVIDFFPAVKAKGAPDWPRRARANLFHIGYHVQYGWHVGIGYVRTPLKPGQMFPPAGWHFYATHAFHPRFGDIKYSSIIGGVGGIALAPLGVVEGLNMLNEFARESIDRFCNSGSVRLVAAWDPNSIEVSPATPYISPDRRLSFTVYFENLPQANFPAEDVTIKLVLDNNLDIDTLTFDGSSHPNVLTTSIDKESRIIYWRFSGIQLPPNQSPPEGEGWARFSVNLKQNLPSGTEIRAKAEIRFDENPPITTNEVMVRVDSQPPSTQLTALSEEYSRSPFEVQWQAQDDLSGVAITYLWVNEERADGRQRQQSSSNNQGKRMVQVGDKTYLLHQMLTPEGGNKVQFRAKFGYRYHFIATSADIVGNEENLPDQPQAVTRFGRAPQISQGLRIVAVPVQSEDDDPK
ncbi:MAG: hypothetical protein NZ937_09130, partial [Armatimonadetes bacterium]|nr:hypothetical protein [Armatimonadota bacterium]